MILFIYSSSEEFYIPLEKNYFFLCNLFDAYNADGYISSLRKINEDEYYYDSVTKILDGKNYNDVDAIVIDKNLSGQGWSTSINIVGHIVCSNFKNANLGSLPIILTDQKPFDTDDKTIKNTTIINFFQTPGIYFRTHQQVFSEKLDIRTGNQIYQLQAEIPSLRSSSYKCLDMQHPVDNRHQSANEWGAMKLAANFGVLNEIKFTAPDHLYFKYLKKYLANSSLDVDKSMFSLFKSVLLIDDNANYGWKEVLTKILNCQVDIVSSVSDINKLSEVVPTTYRKYDLILLDLYLTRGISDAKVSLTLLKEIKGKFPQIPVIMFTASDKTWNFIDIVNSGAEGLYIKESPLYYSNTEYSLNNFLSFKRLLRDTSIKYEFLRPYWEKISSIIKSKSFTFIDNERGRFRSRIEERLLMFYGLVKKGYQQSEYDKSTFHYSDYSLAFLTLWSVSNEIVEYSFVKKKLSFPLSDINGCPYFSHPNQKNRISRYLVCWKFYKDESYLINYLVDRSRFGEPDGKLEKNLGVDKAEYGFLAYSNFSVIKSTGSGYKFNVVDNPIFDDPNSYNKIGDYTGKIYFQLAFLVCKIESVAKEAMLANLSNLNTIRNHLYLIHNDGSKGHYYNKTEKEKRFDLTTDLTKDINDLFSLIAFILTDGTC